MRYWIVPSSNSIFRIDDAIKNQGGMADWRTEKFAKGDIVFIYKTAPEKCIRYKMEVSEINIDLEDTLNQEEYWTDKELYYNGITAKNARLKIIEEYSPETFSLQNLHNHGYQGNPQSVKECKKGELLDYLLKSNPTDEEEIYDVDYPDDVDDMYEGALMKVRVNKYERSQKARKECVEKKGYRCWACGKDLEEMYGEIGKGFIHIHHLTPISTIGKEYKLNVETDLVPVCPNCHYMLHRKNPPYTIEELKAFIQHQDRNNVRQSTSAKATKLTEILPGTPIRIFIHNLMTLEQGTSINHVVSECSKNFHEEYSAMSFYDWNNLISNYIKNTTKKYDLKNSDKFRYKLPEGFLMMAAEDIDSEK